MKHEKLTGELVLVEWVDSYGASASWTQIDPDLEPEPLTCWSVGWLVYNGKACKTVVPHKTTDNQGMGDLTIPTSVIKTITVLRPQGEQQ